MRRDLSPMTGYRCGFKSAQFGASEEAVNLHLHCSNTYSKEPGMGNGPSRTRDSEKRSIAKPVAKPPLDTERSLAEGVSAGSGAEGGDGTSGSFCTRAQVAEFNVLAEIAPKTMVRLIIGQPPAVRSLQGGQLGELTGQSASAMRSCLELGYEMEGTVATRLVPGEVGRVVVKGHR
jgi:hypothetical protein